MQISNDENLDSKEIIFYLDISTEFLKKKGLLKSLKSFMDANNKVGNFTYGFVIFKKQKEVFSIYDQIASFILEKIEDIWEEREEGISYFENGLYETLAHIFKKSRIEPKIYRIIVISDTPSTQSEEYHTALYNLVLKAKNFHTFIDIIRIGEDKFYEDDVKLKVLTSETFGGTLYCNESKQFSNYLNSLVRSKSEFNLIKAESKKILEDEHTFYDKLATDLISLSPEDKKECILCEQELCPICEAYSDEVHKCYNCNSPYHSCCAAEYSIVNNIGLAYIFRCPKCSAILKLDKDFVEMVLEEKTESGENLIEGELISEESNQAMSNIDSGKNVPEVVQKKVKVGGFFGKEVTINANSSKKDTNKALSNGENVSITSLRPPQTRKSVTLCSICGATVKDSIICPVCGSKIT
ncbi:MAG: hypothetical protein JXA99_02450 [Candidatus Lokiarchaeota archaeon]|nr:hypothetical protein [Candidatus Lokiarchaeota archaeon]